MDYTENCVRRFYELGGTTLGERRRAFNIYFNTITSYSSTPEEVKTFFEGLKPRNRLEEILHLTLLLHYKQRDQLLEILYNEDSILIKLLLKDGTFLQDTFKDFDADQFLDFLDKVSFVVRTKIITRLSKMPDAFENDKLDSYYFAIKEKYGLNVAKSLLCGCNLKIIKPELEANKILLSNNQLTRIYERSFRAAYYLEEYFAHLKKNNVTNFRGFIRLIKLLAATNTDLYWKLLKQYEFGIDLSYQQTILVLKKHKQEFVKDIEKYKPIFNKRAIIKSLNNKEFKLFFAQILPKTIDEFDVNEVFNDYSDPAFYLKNFTAKSKRFEILQEVFKSKYKANILDHEEFVNEMVLELVPVKDRDDIIAKKFHKEPPEDAYIAFYETDKALDLIKKKISNTTNASTRMEHVAWLVKVCKVNDDMKRWPEVLEYILKRHKNEDNSFYSVIFRSIQDFFELSKFDQKMWDAINAMIDAFRIRFKTTEYTLNTFQEFYMKFKLQNNLPIVEDVSKILEDTYKDHACYKFWNNEFLMRKCLEAMPEIIPKQFEGKKLRQAINMYYNTVKDFNRNRKRNRIDFFKHDFIVKYWEDEIANEKSDATFIFDDLSCLRSQPELVQKIIKLIWEGKRTEDYQWGWFLKYQPQDIVVNYERFFEDKTGNRKGLRRFAYNVTCYSHLGLPELFFKKSRELLQTKDLPGECHQYVAAVRFLVYDKDFLQIVQPLLPEDSTMKSSPDEKNSTEVRQVIARVIGSCKEKSKVLDTLAVIAKGDYLQFALFSMHKIMYHTAEYKLQDFLEKIAGGSVSLRKHVIFILAGISTVQNIYETFKKIGETETNPSVNTYLLHTTLQYFQQNPSEQFFELTKQHAKLLEPGNEEGHAKLVDLQKLNIPIKFLPQYMDFIWGFIIESTNENILKLRFRLLENTNDLMMDLMTEELLQKFVKSCLDFEKVDLQNVCNFVFKYIIERETSDVVNRINLVVGLFPKQRNDLENARAAKNVGKFIAAFCKQIIKTANDEKLQKVDVKHILTEFAKACSKNVSFKSSVWLNLTKMYSKEDHTSFVSDFSLLYTSTVKNLTAFIIHPLAKIFSNYVATFASAEKLDLPETLLDFCVQFLGKDNSTEKELFVVLVLPKTVSKSENILKKHLQIMKLLNESESDVVKTAISCYLESVSYVKKNQMDSWEATADADSNAASDSE